ncbi:MAG: ring-cleaving dioxygenase [Janthinobacterium lividum]
MNPIAGLHHVTAIASNPQRNLDFYTEVLGLRFVKKTVNFDDPGTYHFYFGDDTGAPGTILTFFPWPHATKGKLGVGEVRATAFSIPAGSLAYWIQRLRSLKATFDESTRFDAQVIGLADPDGMRLELIEQAEAHAGTAPRYSDVPSEFAIQGFYGVTLLERRVEPTAALLDVMGFKALARDGAYVRFAPDGDALGRYVDVLVDPQTQPGRQGAGSVHHIAFRNTDDVDQLAWHDKLAPLVGVTPVQERTYFRSIYFREPGGVLFEMATDTPGFLIDEQPESLGEALRIPEWYEPQRAAIEARLLPLKLHKFASALQEVGR